MFLMEELSSFWWELGIKPGKHVTVGEEIGEENDIEMDAWHMVIMHVN